MKNNTFNQKELEKNIDANCGRPYQHGCRILSLEIARKVFQLGLEKVIINSALENKIELLAQIGAIYGAQAVVASIDYKKSFLGVKKAYFASGSRKSAHSPIELAQIAEKAGAGELILNSIDLESTCQGYNLELLIQLVDTVKIPVVISGGASSNQDFDEAKQLGASGIAVGSMFVYQRPYNAVLISYPSNYFNQ